MKNIIQIIAISILLLAPVTGFSQVSEKSTISALTTNWTIVPSTIGFDENDKSKYSASTQFEAQFEAQLNVTFSSLAGIDSIKVRMERENGEEDYFNLTLVVNESANTNEISIELNTEENKILIHAGQYSNLSLFKVSAQVIYSDGTLGELKNW
jgi:hypothetical protein